MIEAVDEQELYLRFEETARLFSDYPDIDAFYTTDTHLLKYYTGISLSYGALLVSKKEPPVFMVDSRYFDVLSSSTLWQTELISDTRDMTLQRVLKKLKAHCTIAFQADLLSYEEGQKLVDIDLGHIIWKPNSILFSQIRRRKTAYELAAIARSCALCERGFTHILPFLQEGVSEKTIRQRLLLYWLEEGMDAMAFDPIIAFGSNSAYPHWRSSNTLLQKGDIVLIDIGVTLSGYASDMTRTFSFGAPTYPEFDEWFKAVHEALLISEQNIVPNVSGKTLDMHARDFLMMKGFGAGVCHSLGHGVGLDVHEAPKISYKASDKEPPLQEGDVITLEPGLYFRGKGGCRLENSYRIGPDGHAVSYMSLPIVPRLIDFL